MCLPVCLGLFSKLHSNADMRVLLTCRMGADILSFTAPCRSEDVESMVKVSVDMCVFIHTKGDKKLKK